MNILRELYSWSTPRERDLLLLLAQAVARSITFPGGRESDMTMRLFNPPTHVILMLFLNIVFVVLFVARKSKG